MAPLQVLTLNVWGLWLVSRKRYNRILHLAEFLANDAEEKHKLDVVLLQEVWVDEDVRVLTSAARIAGLSYSMHFRSGVFGSGLLTLSRFPITEAEFHQYNCAGDPMSITCGDYLAAKGVGWTRLATPSGPLDVFNTHLHANYSHKYEKSGGGPGGGGSGVGGTAGGDAGVPPPPIDEFAAFRVAQVLELTRFIRRVSQGAGGVTVGTLLGGDLNCGPHTLEATMLRALLPPGLKDCWVVTHGSDEAGHTCKAAGNSFKPRRQQPSRIDYLWTDLGVASCDIALERTPEGHSYSDHFAVQARLELPSATAAAAAAASMAEQQSQAGSAPAAAPLPLLRAAQGVLAEGTQRAAQATLAHTYFSMIMALQAVGLCLFGPFMTLIGRPINPALGPLIPAVVLVLAAGACLMFLTGMVADAGQTRALQQALAQMEVQVALRAAEGQGKGKATGGKVQR